MTTRFGTLVQNVAPIDAWSLVHIATGYGLALLQLRPSAVWVGNIAFEVLENLVESTPGNVFGTNRPESLANVVTDVALTMGTYYVTRHLINIGALPGFDVPAKSA
jgi:hypothetical protein